ncbi:hypothetical protein UPYG_G00164310 [Umbra pygmaea]|uniref:Uncharacterized protein n=1 Tax=Umbra pygmaea TaxID=75934 RepID=A0ABD0WRX5_UMBPY
MPHTQYVSLFLFVSCSTELRKAQKRVRVLKQQVETSEEKTTTAHHYLASIVALAEKTTQERDQLVYMASSLKQDKQGVITRVVEGTLRLGKLQEKVKVGRLKHAGFDL